MRIQFLICEDLKILTDLLYKPNMIFHFQDDIFIEISHWNLFEIN